MPAPFGKKEQVATDRPPLGFEYEIAIAKVNTAADLTFVESPPAIVGSYVIIACTREIRCVPPADQFKRIASGYNPAAFLIPGASIPGALTFEAADKPSHTIVETYGGQMCVARLRSTLDGTSVVRTWYCSFWVPVFTVIAPDGESEGRFSAQGDFTNLSSV